MINTNIRKKVLGLAVACALLGGSVAVPFAASASPLDDPEDAAYVERTAVADHAKAKAEAPQADREVSIAAAVSTATNFFMVISP